MARRCRVLRHNQGMDLDRDACYRALLTRDARFDGHFFTCVLTTRIYCRPICPARPPKLANCVFLPSAAAAQAAGFRPCLRCRPEASPDLALWRGTSNTVSRALALIADGALDQQDVGELGDRLGMGERHLRRLFQHHLGASPVSVAQTRRLLFAKKLISETQMPMVEVALASGFGSVRRFNAAVRRVFGRAPRELRRGHGRSGAGDGSSLELKLPFAAPYDWPAMISFLRTRAIVGVEEIDDRTYRRTIEIDGTHGLVSVRPASDGASHLLASLRLAKLSALPAIVARLRRVFDLGADPGTIASHLSEDPSLAPLIAARPGLRVPGGWDGFEMAIRAILGQQVTLAAARGLAAKLVAAYGEALSFDTSWADPPGGLRLVFPRPERLVDVNLAATLGMPRARAAAITSLARAAVEDKRLFHPTRSLDETVARLRSLPGIGEWSAQYIAMRWLREPDAFPAADIGLRRAMAVDGTRPSPTELLRAAERWRPWRAYAAQHLWTADVPLAAPSGEGHGFADRPHRIADRNHSARL
jgi:AraC family transcriptional regulator, regulatory protein of adaptative response / DNA-3-methyladenine glycosylase II